MVKNNPAGSSGLDEKTHMMKNSRNEKELLTIKN